MYIAHGHDRVRPEIDTPRSDIASGVDRELPIWTFHSASVIALAPRSWTRQYALDCESRQRYSHPLPPSKRLASARWCCGTACQESTSHGKDDHVDREIRGRRLSDDLRPVRASCRQVRSCRGLPQRSMAMDLLAIRPSVLDHAMERRQGPALGQDAVCLRPGEGDLCNLGPKRGCRDREGRSPGLHHGVHCTTARTTFARSSVISICGSVCSGVQHFRLWRRERGCSSGAQAGPRSPERLCTRRRPRSR